MQRVQSHMRLCSARACLRKAATEELQHVRMSKAHKQRGLGLGNCGTTDKVFLDGHALPAEEALVDASLRAVRRSTRS